MRAISLFSGAGGFELGFERAGIETVLQAEQDPWCLEVLARHWPSTERVKDVRDVGQQQSIDLVYGGFPCQDVSVAGKRAGLSGERSGLWHEFHRVLRELRPRWAVIENVPGLLSSNRGRDLTLILLQMEELGYGWAYRVLDARWIGVPQRRRRVFIVGCLGDAARAAQVLAVCESCGGHPAPGREARQGAAPGAAAGAGVAGKHLTGADPNGIARPLVAPATGYRMDLESENFLLANALEASDGHHGYSSPRGDGADNLIAQTLNSSYAKTTASGGSHGPQAPVNVVTSGAGVRRLTPLECERLMGWPDEHTRWTADGKEIPDSHRYRLCGNGVVATVAEWLGHRLLFVEDHA